MQRWSHDTLPSGKSGGGDAPQPSFLEVLLTGINARSAPAATKSPTQPASPCGASPRIVVRPYAPRRATSTTGPDADGWHPVVSRRTRKELHRLERRPRRPVPADLRGKCFNCLSPTIGRRRAVLVRGASGVVLWVTGPMTARRGMRLRLRHPARSLSGALFGLLPRRLCHRFARLHGPSFRWRLRLLPATVLASLATHYVGSATASVVGSAATPRRHPRRALVMPATPRAPHRVVTSRRSPTLGSLPDDVE